MKITITNEVGDRVSKMIQLHISDIKEAYYEDWVKKSGENNSYFMIYIDNPEIKSNTPTWVEVKIPFDYENRCGKIVPIYEEKLSSYELYIDDELIVCELLDDEQLMLINIAIRALLEDFVYCDTTYKEYKEMML